MRLFFFSCFCFSACASLAYRSSGPYEGGPVLGPGTYLAEVVVHPAHGAATRFTALFSRKPLSGVALFTALSTSGKLIFRARDTLRVEEKPELDFFPANMPLEPALLADFYQSVRPLLLLNDDPRKPGPLVRERHEDGRPASLGMPGGPALLIKEYDWEGHVFRAEVESSAFKAEVTFRQYQISP
jgi:hypothetical protein